MIILPVVFYARKILSLPLRDEHSKKAFVETWARWDEKAEVG
jgi:hypothetical protein